MDTILIFILPFTIMVFSIYLLLVMNANGGALRSISDSDYKLKWPFRWTFEVMMFWIGVVLNFIGMFLYWDRNLWLLMISGSSIFLIGVFSEFKRNFIVYFLHVFFTIIGYGGLIISFWYYFGHWYFSLLIISMGLSANLLSNDKNIKIWNMELTLSFSIFFFLFTEILKEVMYN